MAAWDYTNDVAGVLTAGYTSGGTTLQFSLSAGSLPTSGRLFILQVLHEGANTDEYFLCTSYTGTYTATVVGAQAGSAASNHANGATITGCWWLPQVIDGIRSDQSQIGVYSSLPAAGMKSGDRYKCTDSPHDLIYSGAAWNAFVRGIQATPVSLAAFSWVNQGGSSASQQGASLAVTVPAVSGDQYRSLVKSVPSAPYTAIAMFDMLLAEYNYSQAGLVLRDSGSGKMVVCSLAVQPSQLQLTAAKLASNSSFSANYQTYNLFGIPCPVWLRIRDDATTRFFGFSVDGLTWWEFFSVGRTDYITPNQIGFYGDSNNTTAGLQYTVHSYSD